jgi:hypothetical protein
MSENSDFKDMFKALNTCRVRYLVAGAHAVMHYAEPRYTKDIDIWVEPTAQNATRVWRAMELFQAPLENVTEKDFRNPIMVYQIGVAPNRIDIMMSVPGVRFLTAWRSRKRSTYGGVPINIMSLGDLIKAKARAGRPQDLLDVASLKLASKKTRPGKP